MALNRSTFVAMSIPAPSVLIIDDRMESIALLLAYLKDRSLDVMVALDAADGIHKAVQGQPDVILLDVNLSGIDGYDACRALKDMPATTGIPIIFLSACATVEDRLKGYAAGGVDFIGKPFSADEVLTRVFVHLELARHTGAATRADALEHAPQVAIELGRDFVSMAIVALQRNGLTWPGLEALAHNVGTNEKKLTELFRQRFGMPAYTYLVELRLEQARVSLTNSALQIQYIADSAGYRNASDFSRAFRRRYGLGPRQYRQACHDEAAVEGDNEGDDLTELSPLEGDGP
jgi:DNA-binding response OmpR family regulator